MPIPFFDISRQNLALAKEIKSAVDSVIDSGRYILGDNVSLLEKEVASYCGVKYAVGVASGTDALHLALRSCGIKPGDEVITSPFTFVATAEAIAYCGAIPVFVDIDPKTFNLDASKIEERITPKTKAILPVHLYGQSCEMGKIMSLARNFSLKVVEDCAQSIGAEFNHIKVGSFGDVGCFSFFPTKNLGCFGDGGMITTNDETLANEIKILRGHGSRKTYHYDLIGYNSRLDEIQAAVLRIKLPYLDTYIKLRRKNASLYLNYLKDTPSLSLPYEYPSCLHSFNQFTILLKNRDKLFEHLKSTQIGVMVYYPLSLHLQKVFSFLGHRPNSFPISESSQDMVLSLPIFPELQDSEIEMICANILGFYGKN